MVVGPPVRHPPTALVSPYQFANAFDPSEQKNSKPFSWDEIKLITKSGKMG